MVPYETAFIGTRDFYMLEVQKVGDVLDLGAGQDLPERPPGYARPSEIVVSSFLRDQDDGLYRGLHAEREAPVFAGRPLDSSLFRKPSAGRQGADERNSAYTKWYSDTSVTTSVSH